MSGMRQISGLRIDPVDNGVPGFLVRGDDKTTAWVERKDARLIAIGWDVALVRQFSAMAIHTETDNAIVSAIGNVEIVLVRGKMKIRAEVLFREQSWQC